MKSGVNVTGRNSLVDRESTLTVESWLMVLLIGVKWQLNCIAGRLQHASCGHPEGMQSYEQLATEVTQAAIEQGHCNAQGSAAEAVSLHYALVCRALREIDLEFGSDAMTTSSEFAIASIKAGMLYSAEETADFMSRTAQSIRAVGTELGGGASGLRSY